MGTEPGNHHRRDPFANPQTGLEFTRFGPLRPTEI